MLDPKFWNDIRSSLATYHAGYNLKPLQEVLKKAEAECDLMLKEQENMHSRQLELEKFEQERDIILNENENLKNVVKGLHAYLEDTENWLKDIPREVNEALKRIREARAINA